ncbi:MAG: hypothetical protein ACT4N2_13595 [Hyphomicrobium sp.]
MIAVAAPAARVASDITTVDIPTIAATTDLAEPSALEESSALAVTDLTAEPMIETSLEESKEALADEEPADIALDLEPVEALVASTGDDEPVKDDIEASPSAIDLADVTTSDGETADNTELVVSEIESQSSEIIELEEPAIAIDDLAPVVLESDVSEPTRDDSVEAEATAFEATTDATEAAMATSTPAANFMLAARLAAVAKLNAPSVRATRRGDRVPPAGRAIPMPRGLDIKAMKTERLPTATARPRPPRKSRPSAEIIDITTAKPRLRPTANRRAA